MNWAAIVWFVLMVIFIILEANTVTLVSTWFAAGALAALIASLLDAQLWLQMVLFFVVSILLLLSLRPITKKHFTPKLTKTNLDSVIGSEGFVTATIDNVMATGEVIVQGTRIKVDRIEGVKVYVTPVEVTVH